MFYFSKVARIAKSVAKRMDKEMQKHEPKSTV
jgi:hypothetical protein